MTPYVIDKQKQNQLVLIFIASLIVSFFLGYAFGFQSAMIDRADGFALVPEKENPAEKVGEAEENTSVEQLEAEKEPAEDAAKIDTSQTSEKAKVAVPEVKKVVKAEPRKVPVVTAAKPAEPVKPVVSKPVVAKPAPVTVRKPEPVVDDSKQKQANDSADETNKNDAGLVSAPSTELTDTNVENDKPENTQGEDKPQHFSIQAGMFESRENALKFIEELKSSGFEAYLSDFVSSTGGVKYNVRFGSYEERQQVEEKLASFKQKFSSPAYIVISK